MLHWMIRAGWSFAWASRWISRSTQLAYTRAPHSPPNKRRVFLFLLLSPQHTTTCSDSEGGAHNTTFLAIRHPQNQAAQNSSTPVAAYVRTRLDNEDLPGYFDRKQRCTGLLLPISDYSPHRLPSGCLYPRENPPCSNTPSGPRLSGPPPYHKGDTGMECWEVSKHPSRLRGSRRHVKQRPMTILALTPIGRSIY